MRLVRFKTSLMILASMVVLVSAGCGGGGNGSGGNQPNIGQSPGPGQSPGSAVTSTYLFFSGSIHAVDPANPTAPLNVDSGASHQAKAVYHGTYDSVGKKVSDLHTRTIIYERGGQLFKVSALKGGAAPTPTKLSSEAGAASMVGTPFVAYDLADHGNSRYLYQLPGNLWKMARVGMTAADAPIMARQPLAPIYNSTTGALSGWLAIDGGAVKRFDADFTTGTATVVKAFTTSAEEVAWTFSKVFLRMDGDLYAYDVASGQLSGSLYTYTAPTSTTITPEMDGTSLYFVDGSRVVRVPLSGAGTATVLATATGTIDSFALTDTRVAYVDSVAATGNSSINVVPKGGGSPTPLIFSTADQLFVIAAKGGLVYYSRVSAGVPASGYIIDAGGTVPTQVANSLWSGASYPNSSDPSVSPVPQYLVLATGFSATTGFSGGALLSYDASTAAQTANLGMLPAGMFVVTVFGVGADVLATDQSGVSPNLVLYANLATAGSLRTVMTTANPPQVIGSLY